MQLPLSKQKLSGCWLLLLLSGGTASAIELKPEEMRSREELKPVSVLQQRFFSKRLRPEVGVVAGTFLNEVYTVTTTRGARLGLALTEMFGLEMQYHTTTIKDSEDRKALNGMRFYPLEVPEDGEDNTEVYPTPEVNPINGVVDVNVVMTPFYGKMNLVDRLIVYTDFYFTGGISQVDTVHQGNRYALMLGAGQKFYLLKSWALRLDFRSRIYMEKRDNEDYRKHTYHVDFGVSYFFL